MHCINSECIVWLNEQGRAYIGHAIYVQLKGETSVQRFVPCYARAGHICHYIVTLLVSIMGEIKKISVLWCYWMSSRESSLHMHDVFWRTTYCCIYIQFNGIKTKLLAIVYISVLQTAKVEETYEPISLKNMPSPASSTAADHDKSSTSSTSKHTTIKEKSIKDDTNKVIAGKKGKSLDENGSSPLGPGQSASKISLTGHAVSVL